MTVLPAAAASWYAKRRGVDMQALAESASTRSTLMGLLGVGATAVLTFAALTYTVFTGQPLLTAPSLDVTVGEGALGGAAQGAVVAALVGGVAAVVVGLVKLRRAKPDEVPGD